MISIRIEYYNHPDRGTNTFHETFPNADSALAYIAEYIGAAPMTITEFGVESW